MTYNADILLVEDNHINQIVAQQILTKSGYTVVTASDGESALSLLSDSRFRLILMDVQMPGLDGMETTRAIRGEDNRVADRAVPIVAMTAYASAEDRDQCITSGMNDYIAKPLQIDSFLEMIRLHIRPESPENTSVDGHASETENENQDSERAPYDASDVPDAEDFERQDALERNGNTREAVESAIRDFLKTAAGRSDELDAAISEYRLEDAEQIAENIADSAANVGATNIRVCLLTVQRGCRQEEQETAREAFDRLPGLLKRFRRAVTNEGLALAG